MFKKENAAKLHLKVNKYQKIIQLIRNSKLNKNKIKKEFIKAEIMENRIIISK